MEEEQLHSALVRSVLTAPLTEHDALLWMTLLHTHAIKLRAPVGRDVPEECILPALTQRDAATVVAHLWPDRTDQRSAYIYWYWVWNTDIHTELMEELPMHLSVAVAHLRDRLALEPRVAAVFDENSDDD